MNAPIFAYALTDYLDKLPTYNRWQGSVQSLELARKIVNSEAYFFKSLGFPDGTGTGTDSPNMFAPNASFEGALLIEPYSYLVGITGASIPMGEGELTPTGGFRLQIYDKGSQTFMFQRMFGVDSLSCGLMTGTPYYRRTPYYPPSPFIVLPTQEGMGQLQIEITNTDIAQTQFIQVCLAFAVPKTARDPRNMIMSQPEMVQQEGAA